MLQCGDPTGTGTGGPGLHVRRSRTRPPTASTRPAPWRWPARPNPRQRRQPVLHRLRGQHDPVTATATRCSARSSSGLDILEKIGAAGTGRASRPGARIAPVDRVFTVTEGAQLVTDETPSTPAPTPQQPAEAASCADARPAARHRRRSRHRPQVRTRPRLRLPRPPPRRRPRPTTAARAARWGRVGEDGTVFVRTAEGERAVGSCHGARPDEALAYYARKFDELWARSTCSTSGCAPPTSPPRRPPPRSSACAPRSPRRRSR